MEKASLKQWQRELLKWADVAYNTGQKLIFIVIKREGVRRYHIQLENRVASGEEEYIED